MHEREADVLVSSKFPSNLHLALLHTRRFALACHGQGQENGDALRGCILNGVSQAEWTLNVSI